MVQKIVFYYLEKKVIRSIRDVKFLYKNVKYSTQIRFLFWNSQDEERG